MITQDLEISTNLTELLELSNEGQNMKHTNLPKIRETFFQLKASLSGDEKLGVLHKYGHIQLVLDHETKKTVFAYQSDEIDLQEVVAPVTETVYSEKEILQDLELSNIWIEEMISTKCDELEKTTAWKYHVLESDNRFFSNVSEYQIRNLLELPYKNTISVFLAEDPSSNRNEMISKDMRLERIAVDTNQTNWYQIVMNLFAQHKVTLSLENLLDKNDDKNDDSTPIILDLSTIGDIRLTSIQNNPCRPISIDDLMYIPSGNFANVDRIRSVLTITYLGDVADSPC